MNLFILRHASAGTRRENPLLDSKRSIDKDGKQHCLQLAHILNALRISFDLVISSPLKRSVQTAQLVATETGFEAPILISKALAPEASVPDFLRLLGEAAGRENVLVVGHSPNIQLFLGALLMPPTGSTAAVVPTIRLRKGALARVSFSRGPAVLQGLIDPRMVRALYTTSTKPARGKQPRKKP